jgi:hypothetical protein
MKPYLYTLILLTGWCSARAQADLRIASPDADLGEIRGALPLTHTFELFNDGSETVEILETRAGCGCLVPCVEPHLIEPHGRGALVMQVTTLGQAAGPHDWNATVRFRQRGKESQISVRIRVRLVTEVTVQPAAVTLVTAGTMTQMVTLMDLRPEHLTVVEVQTSSPFLKARVLDQKRDDAGHWLARLQLAVESGFSPGRHEEKLSIISQDTLYRRLEIPVTILKQASAQVSASPSQVLLQPGPGRTASFLIRLRAAGNQPVYIAKVETGSPALTCRWASGPDRESTLRFELDLSRWDDQDFDGEAVRVHFSSPANEILTIPVRVGRP